MGWIVGIAVVGVGKIERVYGAWLSRFDGDLNPGLRVLDLGCGWGHDSRYLVDRGCRVTGFEADSSRLRDAVARVPDATFVVGDMTAGLPFADDTFELVSASLSLHYFPLETTRQIVAEIRRVLTPVGVLLARVNVHGDRAYGWGVGDEVEVDLFRQPDGHLKRFFTPQSLRAVLEPAFHVTLLVAEQVPILNNVAKQTLVVRATA